MKAVNLRELKNRLGGYVREVRAGEVILVTDRGVVVAEGKVFSAASGTTLLALDQKTGEVVWQAELRTQPGRPSFANALH